jgi:pyruvate,orthophosphate dikinase
VFDATEVGQGAGDRHGLPAARARVRPDLPQRRSRGRPREKGEQVLLVRVETSPEDLRGMIAAEGILTARGGVSSHAALVARQMGKVCVCGAAARRSGLPGAHGHGRRPDVQGRRLDVDRRHGGQGLRRAVKTAPSEIVAGLIDGDEAAKKTEKFKNFQQLMKWCRRRRA